MRKQRAEARKAKLKDRDARCRKKAAAGLPLEGRRRPGIRASGYQPAAMPSFLESDAPIRKPFLRSMTIIWPPPCGRSASRT